MTAPRIEIDLRKIGHNASTLVGRLATRGIEVTGVTKATLGSPHIARQLLAAGIRSLGDSRIENIEALRKAGMAGSIALIRSPMPSQVERVIASADISFNTELSVLRLLSQAAVQANRSHGVILMVELGDLREGIMPTDLPSVVHAVMELPGLTLQGIGTNLACHSGTSPDASNMAQLSALTCTIESTFGRRLATISGGNSANLNWAFSGQDCGRVNDLRLGESILLGCETLHRCPLDGLYTDAITLVAEVIELKQKPSKPWGALAQTALGTKAKVADRGTVWRSILAIGCQDCDPLGLEPPPGVEIHGASSDHLIVECAQAHLTVGTEVRFQLQYSALLQAMTSPFVAKVFLRDEVRPPRKRRRRAPPKLAAHG
ncbi:MAG TPA: alanine racemase [Lentisphaeria bacterium]|nr:alanine racemase [Lentisphaeria bacterium]